MKLAILGPGRIADKVTQTLVQMPEIECYAVASRTPGKAAAFAEKFGFQKAYTSYEEMLADEAVELVMFAFTHGKPGDLFIQKSPASTIEVLAQAVQQLFGDTGTQIIGTRHGEKLYETLMTSEERLRSEDMGNYFRVGADIRDLNYDKYVVDGNVQTMADESYTSHNTERLNVAQTVQKLLTTSYVQQALQEITP